MRWSGGKKTKWAVTIFLSILILLILSTVIFKEKLEELLKEVVINRLEESYKQKIKIQKLSFHLLPSYFEIEDLNFSYDYNNIKISANINKLDLYITPWSLLTNNIFIDKIKIIKPQILIFGDEDNLLNLLDIREKLLPKPNNESQGKQISINNISIEDGELFHQDSRGIKSFSLARIKMHIKPDSKMENYHISFTVEPKLSSSNFKISEFINSALGKPYSLDGKIEGDLLLSKNKIQIKKLELISKDIQIKISGSISDFNLPNLELSIDSALDMDNIAQDRFSGKIALKGDLNGKYPDLLWKGNTSLKEFKINGNYIGEISFENSFENKNLIISNISAEILKGTVSGNMNISIKDNDYSLSALIDKLRANSPEGKSELGTIPLEYNGKIEFNNLNLYYLKDIYPPFLPLLKNKMILSGKIEGHGKDLNINSLESNGWIKLTRDSIESHEEEPSPYSLIKEVHSQFNIKDSSLNIKDGEISTYKSLIKTNGEINKTSDIDSSLSLSFLKDMKLSLDIDLSSNDINEFGHFLKPDYIKGTSSFKGKLSGTISNPILQGVIKGDELEIKGKGIGSGSSDIKFINNKLLFKKALLKKDRSTYEFSGEISFNELPTPYFDIGIKVKDGIPNDVISIFYKEIPLKTSADGKISIKGKSNNILTDIDLSVKDGKLYGQEFDKGNVKIIIDKKGIIFSKVVLFKNKSRIEGNGGIGFDKSFRILVKAKDMSISDVSLVKEYLTDLKGILEISIKGDGFFDDPNIIISASMKDLYIYSNYVGEGSIQVNIKNNTAKIETFIETILLASADIKLNERFPIKGEIELLDFETSPYLQYFKPNPLISSIKTSGNIKIEGELLEIKKVNVSGKLDRLNINISGYDLKNNGDIIFSYKNNEVRLNALSLKGEGTLVQALGNLKPSDSYDLFVKGEVDLRIIKLFVKDISYGKGKAYADLKISDQWNDPKITGTMTIENGLIKSETIGQNINIKQLSIFFNERYLILESFEGEVEGGKFKVTGKGDISKFTLGKYALLFEIKGFKPKLISGLTNLIDCSLIFEGDFKKKVIKGEINIRKASYEKRADWKSWLFELIKKEKEKEILPPFIKNTELNIHLMGKENILINNNLAKMPLEVDLFIKGTIDNPLLLGRIESSEGKVYFQRNEFKVLSAYLEFTNPEKTKPVFDFKGTTNIKKYDISLSVNGTIDKFNLSLSSDPYLSDTDILGLLTVGKTAEEISTSQKEVGTFGAASIVTGKAQDIIEEKVQEFTGINRFQVDPYYSGTKASAGPRLTIEKRMWEDKLFVIYSSGIDPADDQLIELEYLLNKNVSLIGEKDESGRVSGELKLRFEFK